MFALTPRLSTGQRLFGIVLLCAVAVSWTSWRWMQVVNDIRHTLRQEAAARGADLSMGMVYPSLYGGMVFTNLRASSAGDGNWWVTVPRLNVAVSWLGWFDANASAVRSVNWSGMSWGGTSQAAWLQEGIGRVRYHRGDWQLERFSAILPKLALDLHGRGVLQTSNTGPTMDVDFSFTKHNPGLVAAVHVGDATASPSVDVLARWPSGGHVRATSQWSAPSMTTNIVLDHVQVGEWDIASRWSVSGEWVPGVNAADPPQLIGSIHSSQSVVNLTPIDELQGRFRLGWQGVVIEDLTWGHYAHLNGSVQWIDAVDTALTFSLSSLNLMVFQPFRSAEHQVEQLGGWVEGACEVQGAWPDLVFEGEFEVLDILIGELVADRATFQAHGYWPYMSVSDSWLHTEAGALPVVGTLDLRRLGQRGAWQHRRGEGDVPGLGWHRWDVDQGGFGEDLSLRRSLSEGVSIGFKSYINDTVEGWEPEDELELGYHLSESEAMKLRLSEEEELMQMEHRREF